jgi:hypothetical protein
MAHRGNEYMTNGYDISAQHKADEQLLIEIGFTKEELGILYGGRLLTDEQAQRLLKCEQDPPKLAHFWLANWLSIRSWSPVGQRNVFTVHYEDYIKSPEWKSRAEAAKNRAGNRCQVCNGRESLNAHHRTYENLGNEGEMDLIVLCKDCHKLFHDNGKLRR